jgi:fibronectin type 3 domain-containing protein
VSLGNMGHRLLCVSLGLVLLVTSSLARAAERPDCGKPTAAPSVESGSAAERLHSSSGSEVKKRSVKLSWKPSIPASSAPADAVAGYVLYRRENGTGYQPLNSDLIPGTDCVDHAVNPGHTYSYRAQGVARSGLASRLSREAKASVLR